MEWIWARIRHLSGMIPLVSVSPRF
jgi:hypothetical protein